MWSTIFAALFLCGCARAQYFPDQPVETTPTPAGIRMAYDVSGNGVVDYVQTRRGPVKRVFRFIPVAPGRPPHEVDWDRIDKSAEPQLFLLLDGVPYSLMAELWSEGSFRLFHRPGMVIGTFPSLTDLAFSELLGSDAPLGYEASYFDRNRNRLSNGTRTYLNGLNEPWRSACDYRLSFIEDAIMYLFPVFVYRQELKNARRVLDAHRSEPTVLYLLSTDGLGHMRKPEQVKRYLRELDRWIERAVFDRAGRLQVTILSDHGNTFVPTRPLRLTEALRRAGLNVRTSLRRAGDVCVPAFGLIDFAAIYTVDTQTRDRVLRACLQIEGIELIFHPENDGNGVLVWSGIQKARIRWTEGAARFAYETLSGDPLGLRNIVHLLAEAGQLDADGFAPDRAWLESTRQHVFPDPLYRIWRALFENTQNPADLLLSLAPGWHTGDTSLDPWVKMEGTHGGLRAGATNGILMSTSFEPAPWLRPVDALPMINRHVPWNPRVKRETPLAQPAHTSTPNSTQRAEE